MFITKRQLSKLIKEALSYKPDGASASSTSDIDSKKASAKINIKDTDKVVLAGDSQMGRNNGFGSVLQSIFPNAKITMISGGHAGSVSGDSQFNTNLKDAKLVVLTLGGHPGNKSGNVKGLINKIKKGAPDAQIVWIGAPPAAEPASSNSMVSKDEGSPIYWKKKKEKRGKRNKLIAQIVNTIKNATFIDPYDYMKNYKSSPDGVHVPLGEAGWLKSLF